VFNIVTIMQFLLETIILEYHHASFYNIDANLKQTKAYDVVTLA